MVHLLYKYLILNQSVNVPGLGVFYVRRTPAIFDFANKVFNAPTFSINFETKTLVNNNLLYAFISREQKIGEPEAIMRLYTFSESIRKSLEVEGRVELPGLGVLQQNDEGKIQFAGVLSPDTYFPAVSAHKLIRENAEHQILVGDTSRTNTHMKEMLVEDAAPAEQEKESWWIFAIVLAIIGIATIVYYYLHNGNLQ